MSEKNKRRETRDEGDFLSLASRLSPLLSTLTLTHFRNYPHAELHCSGSPVLLIGPNGAGKTNILEAISLFSPGRGLRRASLGEMQYVRHCEEHSDEAIQQKKDTELDCFAGARHDGRRWAVSISLQRSGMSTRLGTGLDITEGGMERRLLRIDGQPERSQAVLLEHLSVLWLTPAMGQMFSEGGSVRRRFLDRLVYGFDPEHAGRIAAYEHHTRERGRLLAKPAADRAWLAVLEQKMAEYSVAIAAARLQSCNHLALSLAQTWGSFPAARLLLRGLAEEALEAGQGALEIEEEISSRLAAARGKDAAVGRASVGAHKTKLEVWLMEKHTEAAQCSTGEQKALLLSILLAQARASTRWRGFAPILLLDEVVAHLDTRRRAELFAELNALGVQCFLTGTDAADFSAAGEGAQVVRVEGGKIR